MNVQVLMFSRMKDINSHILIPDEAELVSQRLAGFLAVQNTYQSTFQMLGSLGLLIGTRGLAAVMVRNIVERRHDFRSRKPGRRVVIVPQDAPGTRTAPHAAKPQQNLTFCAS